jgi:hypothetical protein
MDCLRKNLMNAHSKAPRTNERCELIESLIQENKEPLRANRRALRQSNRNSLLLTIRRRKRRTTASGGGADDAGAAGRVGLGRTEHSIAIEPSFPTLTPVAERLTLANQKRGAIAKSADVAAGILLP